MFPTYSTMSPEERDEMVQWYIDGLEEALAHPGDEFYLKACQRHGGGGTGPGDADGYLPPVGFCGWEVIDREHSRAAQTAAKTAEDSAQSDKQQQQQQEKQQDETEGEPPNTNATAKKQRGNQLPETLDVDAWLALSSKLRTERMCILKGRDNICRLTFMAVHPDSQGRGIGSVMLQRVCDETDKVPRRSDHTSRLRTTPFNVPSQGAASGQFRDMDAIKAILGPISELFLAHQVHEQFGIGFLHKHFHIKPTERLVDYHNISAPLDPSGQLANSIETLHSRV
ncbi:hypothetical protein FJTKL_01981 [Diaporthe vaccinii]|uniref:N-acetyltransferase domain-containing protein n=1 Tax=Diaporthe vaccinii TaxID=105482 RepID=A0ABR4DZL8_9PEZI